ncbi:hypothetical protein ACTFIV_001272 [Dictyostelium citrinum]
MANNQLLKSKKYNIKAKDEIRFYIDTIYHVLKNESNNLVQEGNSFNVISSTAADVLGLSKKLLNYSNEQQQVYSESNLKYSILLKSMFQCVPGFKGIKQDEISNITRITNCNSHSYVIPLGEKKIASGLYPLSSYSNHSCVPNSNYFIDKNGVMVLYASSDIQESQPITTSYIFGLDRVEKRREELLKNFNFFCTCEQCNYQSLLTEEVCDTCKEIIPSTIGNSNSLVYKEPESSKETGFNYICPKGHIKSSTIFEIDPLSNLYPSITEINSKCKDLRNFRKVNIFMEMLDNREMIKELPSFELETIPLAKHITDPKKSKSMLIEELIILIKESVEGGIVKSIEESAYSFYIVNLCYDLYKSLLIEQKSKKQKIISTRDIIIRLLTPTVYNALKIDKKLNKHLDNK